MSDKRALGFMWIAVMLLASALATVLAEDVVCTVNGSECAGLTGTCVDSYSCDATALTCQPTYTADGEGSCSDANGNPSKCDGNGGCKLADLCVENSVVCNTPGNVCLASSGTCNPADGTCTYAPLADGEGSCTDTNANPSTCDGSGGCKTRDLCAENSVVCDTPGNVCLATTGTCNPATGTCSYDPKPAGEACTKDGFEGKCDGAAEPSCDLCADGCEPHPNVCMDAGTCNPENGTCSYVPLPPGSVCLKNGLEGKCDGEVQDDPVDDDDDEEEEHPKCDLCADVVCTPEDFGQGCVKGECNSETKQCEQVFKKDGGSCNKGRGLCTAGVCTPKPTKGLRRLF